MRKRSTGSTKMRSVNKKLAARLIVLIIAVLLMVSGLKSNGFKDVRNKAIMICYECMGIG